MPNAIVWADIPVTDMDRAKKFYGAVLQTELMSFPGQENVAIPPRELGPIAFDLAKTDRQPSTEGPTVYLGSMGDINAMVKRVEDAGGTVLQPPTDMGPMVGIIAFILDSEGNRIGIQQMSDQKAPGQ